MALISTQTLTLKSPPTFSLPSHPSSQSPSLSPPNPQSLSLFYTPKSTPRFTARRLVVSRATSTSNLDFSPSIGEVLGDVGVFTAAGDSVQFKDLWDQNEVKFYKFPFFFFLKQLISILCNLIPCGATLLRVVILWG